MKKFTLVCCTGFMAMLMACGDTKTEPAAATPAGTETATTAPAPAPAAETVVDTVEAAIETSTKELEERTSNMKKALENL